MADWFAPKRYGYGSGMPIAWQGWVVLLVYGGVLAGAIAVLHRKPAAVAAIIVPATLLLVLVAARTTRGGWRWRWGGRDQR